MLIKLGVNIANLNRPIRRALKTIEHVFNSFGEKEAVITSTEEGNHGVSSLHYNNNAVDIRLPVQTQKTREIFEALKQKLGNDFDVVLEFNHFHIEYDID